MIAKTERTDTVGDAAGCAAPQPNYLAQQQAIKARCFHPSRTVSPWDKADLEQSIAHRFEAQVRRYPERVAVKTVTREITYRELNRLANRVARLVLACEIGPEEALAGMDSPAGLACRTPARTAVPQTGPARAAEAGPWPVALLVEDDVLMIAAILGVLKAGHIMLPLDPAMPADRLARTMGDALPPDGLVLASGQHLSLAHEAAQGRYWVLDLDMPLEHVPADNPRIDVSPDSPAYLMYTSGSTGQPKGIVHPHRNVLHNVMNYTRSLHISPRDRLTLLHSYSFSSAQVDMFCALLNGATLYPWHVKEQGLAGLAQWLAAEGVTIFSWSPTPFRHFVATLLRAAGVTDRSAEREEGHLPALRIVALGGEPVSARDVDLYKAWLADDCVFVNRLGTTETNNFRLFFVEKSTRLPRGRVPVGYAVPGKEVLIVDPEDRRLLLDPLDSAPAAPVTGEIAVRSRYLALGYWRGPELTQAAFRSSPEAGGQSPAGDEAAAMRIYYTGDLGTLHPDGRLDHLGRKDFQVKVRGYRIEPAEVEMALGALPDVRECVVIPRQDEKRQAAPTYLAAYFVPVDGSIPPAAELRQALARTLPEYMIPAAFVPLERLPLTPGGKVDRGALPAPEALDSAGREDGREPAGFIAPRDDVERRLAAAWQQVLGVGPIGVDDNFFELGGHSLSVVRLLVEIEADFGKLSPPVVYQYPTVQGLARRLRAMGRTADDEGPGSAVADAAEGWSPLVMLRAAGSRPPLFVMPGILGNVFTDLGHLARYLGPDQPVYGLQDGPRNPTRIEDHAALYVREIQSINRRGPYLLAGICYGGVLAFEVARQLSAPGDGEPDDWPVALLAMIEPARPWMPGLRTYLSFGEFLFDRFVRRMGQSLSADPPGQRPDDGWGPRGLRLPRGRAEMAEFVRLKYKLAANAWALRRYAPRPYPGPVDFFFTEGSLRLVDNPQQEWYSLAHGRVRTHQIPGSHDSITGDNHVAIEPGEMKVLASKLESRIDKIVAGLSPFPGGRGMSAIPASPSMIHLERNEE